MFYSHRLTADISLDQQVIYPIFTGTSVKIRQNMAKISGKTTLSEIIKLLTLQKKC